jgi:hypothetical protein
MAVFFDIFRRPTIQSQAEQYPTLHNVIPNLPSYDTSIERLAITRRQEGS